MRKQISLVVVFLFSILFALSNTLQASTFVLEGDYLRVGVSDSGGLIDDSLTVGIDYDKVGTSTWTMWDFLKPGSPYEFYSVGCNGGWDSAGYSHGNTFSATSTDTSAGTTNSANTTGSFGPLSIDQNLFYADGAGAIGFLVTITNTSGSAVTDVVYARGLDPDQDVYAGGGFETTNVIDSGNLVYAEAPVSDWTIGIFSDSAISHTASIRADWSSDPYSLLNPINDGYGDYCINMAFNIGTLGAGESARIPLEYRIAETKGGVTNPTPEPATCLLFLLGIVGIGVAKKKFN